MKMNNIIKSMLAVALLSLGACSTDEGVEDTLPAEQVEMVKIRLSTDAGVEILDPASRTMLVGTDVHWHNGDQIALPISYSNMAILSNESTNGANATFVGEVPKNWVTEGIQRVVVYPYMASLSENWGNMANVKMSAEQPLVANTFARNHNISTTYVDFSNLEKSLTFKNVGGLLCLRLKGDAKITKIKIDAPSGAKINGTFSANLTTASEEGAEPTVAVSSLGETTSSVTLTTETALQLTSDVTKVYACVLPYSQTGTYTVTFYNDEFDESSNSMSSISKIITVDKGVVAGGITNLGVFEVNASDFPKPLSNYAGTGVNLSDNYAKCANTYYVSAPGDYAFNACLKGNGKALDYHALSYNAGDLKIAPKAALVLWYNSVQTSAPWTKVSPVAVESVTLDENGYINFTVPSPFVSGNVVIAALEKAMTADEIEADENRYITNNNILWSWNIVCADGYNPDTATNNITTAGGYTLMGRDLGAVLDYNNYTKVDGNYTFGEIVHYNSIDLAYAMGNAYQFGNKNPRPGIAAYLGHTVNNASGLHFAPTYTPIAALQLAGSIGSGDYAAEEQIFQNGQGAFKLGKDSEANVGAWATQNPYLQRYADYSHWINVWNGCFSIWGSYIGDTTEAKTIYDPCPYGWKVASETVWFDFLGITSDVPAGDMSKFSMHDSNRGFVYDGKSIFLISNALSDTLGRSNYNTYTTYRVATYIASGFNTNPGSETQRMVCITANADGATVAYSGPRPGNANGGSVRCVKITE